MHRKNETEGQINQIHFLQVVEINGEKYSHMQPNVADPP